MFAVFGEGGIEKRSSWGPLFDVEDPRSKLPQCKGKFLDVNQALEVARLDIQYCDWRARQDVLTIILLHEKVSDSSPFSQSHWLKIHASFLSVEFAELILWSRIDTSSVLFFNNLGNSHTFFIGNNLANSHTKSLAVGCRSSKSSSPGFQVHWHDEEGSCGVAG